MNKIKIPIELQKMNSVFEKNGFESYLAGGAVRDMILGKRASDWDVATNATPAQVSSIFKKVIPTGESHGTVTVFFMRHKIEVTTYRVDGKYSDGRHPDNVSFAASIEEDLSRRDFTMNAIAASLKDGSLKDPFSGQDDIKQKIIKTVGSPKDRFLEDGLRPVRALRFLSQLDFSIEQKTYEAIFDKSVQEKIKQISIERFKDEFEKILLSKKPSSALFDMEKTGILKLFIPELAECRGVSQKDCRGFHDFDVLDHCVWACDGARQNNLTVRCASLFHDIGKKDTRSIEKKQVSSGSENQTIEVVHFYSHEIRSSQITKQILVRLRFSNAFIEKVCHLVANHMFHYEPSWTDSAVRRFIVKVKPENIEDLFEVRLADIYATHKIPFDVNSESAKNLDELSERIKKILEKQNALCLKDLALNGNDLLALGIPKGKKIGIILNELFQTVLDDPAMNEKEKLLSVAKKLYEKYYG